MTSAYPAVHVAGLVMLAKSLARSLKNVLAIFSAKERFRKDCSSV
jgi:hypothetical protein